MNSPRSLSNIYIRGLSNRRAAAGAFAVLTLLFVSAIGSLLVSGRSGQQDGSPKVGERLTYVISFNNYASAGYAEIHVVSKGALEGTPAIELSGKLKSFDLLSAAFFLWDEERTTFISPESGYPVFVRETSKAGVLPQATVRNYLQQPATALDLLSLIYKVRESGGSGSFQVLEGGMTHSFDIVTSGGEKVSTEAGEFETQVAGVQSTYFNDYGIRDVRINFSADERRIPVLVRFRTEKVDFRATLASIQDLTPKETATATPTLTPTPVVTPTPIPTPRPYITNRPLSEDLPFRLGEKLTYSVTKSGAPVAEVVLDASSRNLFQGNDALRLTATVEGIGSANDIFGAGDLFEAWVDPDTLVPFSTRTVLTGYFSESSQSALFDQSAGTVSVNAGAPLQIPVGTHNLLSLAYAIRAFGLRGSVDPSDPVNDTRVAVFVSTEPLILTLRPAGRETLEIGGRKRQTQIITIRTGNPSTDRLNFRVWLTADSARQPVRFAAGAYQADLVSSRTETPR